MFKRLFRVIKLFFLFILMIFVAAFSVVKWVITGKDHFDEYMDWCEKLSHSDDKES